MPLLPINNSEVNAELQDGIKFPISLGGIRYSQDQLVPTFETNPKLTKNINIVRDANSAASGLVTIYTTSATADFYLYAFTLSFIKDATCDMGTGVMSMYTTINGVARSIAKFGIITGTAQTDSISIALPRAVKIDRNSPIYISGTFTAGVLTRAATIFGIEVSNSNS